jgi:M6 family metalloprotease-like protein
MFRRVRNLMLAFGLMLLVPLGTPWVAPSVQAASIPPMNGFTKGTQPLLVILAAPSNQGPVGNDGASYWHNLAFGPFPSAADYYGQASYGQLHIVPAQENSGTPNDGVVGWIRVGLPHPNTGGSSANIGSSLNAAFVTATLQAVAASGAVNFAAFDTNHDGILSPNELRLVVVVAGYEGAFPGAPTPNVWAHASSCLTPDLTLQGVQVFPCSQSSGYVMMGEWEKGTGSNHAAALGTVVHELGHNFGLIDLYNSAGRWSVMGGGDSNTTDGVRGDLPALPDAWSRAFLGWAVPQQVSGQNLGAGIPQAENSPVVFQLLPNPGGMDGQPGMQAGTGEYFLVENRQLVGYDAGLPGCGLLIWHIDEGALGSLDPNRPAVTLVQADGLNDIGVQNNNFGDAADPFPGTSGNRSWGISTNPSSALFSGQASGAAVDHISDCAPMMSADLYSPVALGAPAFPTGSFADLSTADPAYPWVQKLLDLGWTSGCGTDAATGQRLFCPVAPITRREMAKFLVTAAGVAPMPGGTPVFEDVPASDWAYAWVQALANAQWTDGCGTDPATGGRLFCPNDPVSRAQMAKFLATVTGLSANSFQTEAFNDVTPANPAYPWVQALYSQHVSDGCSYDPATGVRLFCPDQPVTRAQMAKFLISAFAPSSAP